jgi:hypothetical protein
MPKKDLNQLAHSIMEQATSEEPKAQESVRAKSGRAGGLKGGKTRMEGLTPEEKHALALKAAAARWSKKAPAEAGATPAKSVKKR